MPEWGRPLKGGVGTERLDLRLRKDLKKILDTKIPDGLKTQFIEEVLEPALKSLDPGEPCNLVCKLPEILSEAKEGAINAIKEGRFEDAVGFLYVAKSIADAAAPYIKLCDCPSREKG
jgi:hypothetical protein